jgi:hypothetical protein
VDARTRQQLVESVADAIREREDELVERMLARFAAEVPDSGVGTDPEMTAAMRRSCHGNLRAALAHAVREADPLPFGPPSDAIDEARIGARTGTPLVAGLRTYRIGEAVAWEALQDAVDALEDVDPATRSALLRRWTRAMFAYVDAVIPFVVDEYTRERERLLRGREQRRVQLVRDVLDGGDVDSGALGYDLAATHRAVVAWGPGAEAEIGRIAAAAGAPCLVVSVGEQTCWGWLAGAGGERDLRGALDGWEGGLALGRPARGPDGFRRSHREARAAHRIGAATGDPVTRFDDVALESVLLADERAARAFVAAELGPLGDGRDGTKLRETLVAYFACGFNASAAAAALGVNDRTVAYRLGGIEERLGRPVRTRQAELQAAIRLERVLGAPPPR